MKFAISHTVWGYTCLNGQTSARRFLEETEIYSKSPAFLMRYILHYMTIGTFSSVKLSLS